MDNMPQKFCTKVPEKNINPIKPLPKHSKIEPLKPRKWETAAALPSFKPTIRNYYQPLYLFAHFDYISMVQDKAQAAAAMRVRMGKLRSGTTNQPATG
jgi:hypothetical protein